jgi:hypothetical protein
MDDVASEMKKLKSKKDPTVVDVRKYVRYMINVLKYDADSVYEDVPHWKKAEVAKAMKEVERENSKPRPQRYYVSLKEPMGEER